MKAPPELHAQDGDWVADGLRELIEEGFVKWEVLPDGSIGYGLTERGIKVCEVGEFLDGGGA